MKNFIVVLVVGAMFASCKRAYTCTCTGGSIPSGVGYAYNYSKTTKKNAEANCETQQNQYQPSDPGIKCRL